MMPSALRRHRPVVFLLALLAAIAVLLVRPFQPPQRAHAVALPAFGIGLAAHPDSTGINGWMPNSGVPWSYAYQYLSGGVNTGGGWETWNASAQFPLFYANGSASHGYIPVFPYYELLQSNGSCGSCGEAQQDLSNLNNAATMSSYFQNFTLLMQRLGSGSSGGIAGFGQTAIVHVEPDLSGYAMQAVLNNASCYGYCTAQGNNPANLRASVASSGVAEVSAYPNTYQGFNWALLHLRDLYARNVQLAFHISDWATGIDIGSNTSATIDATSLGQQAGSFAAQSGISGLPAGTSSYDLLFNDVLDRDAGYYKYVYGNANVWWDRLNVGFPNFKRWESYLHAAVQAAGRSAVVWQIPEGNQYYDTENNTNGHYQDNRVEYFFAHIAELQQAGVVGLLFGAGNGGSTVHWDGNNDGVTNPAAICNSDGTSSGQICNNHTSSSTDDDGGLLRQQAAQYYSGSSSPDFSLASSPSQLSFVSGGSGSFSVAVTPTGGFNGTVSLVATAAPAGLTLSPASASSAAPGYPMATFTAASSTPATYTVTITGSSGTLSHTTSVGVTVGSPASAQLGNSGAGSATDSGDAGRITGSRFTMGSQAGAVTSISVHVAAVAVSPGNQYQLAIYADNKGKPGALVARSVTGTLTANAWNALPLTASLQAGAAYWLMYQTNGTSAALNDLTYSAGSSRQGAFSGAVAFGTWPSSFGRATFGSQQYSIYATFTPQ